MCLCLTFNNEYGMVEPCANKSCLSMTELRIRKLEDWTVAALRARARRHGHSLEKELRILLREDVLREKKALAERAAARLDKLRQKYGTLSDSAPLIREDRDKRG
jgi:antitoxin FitA